MNTTTTTAPVCYVSTCTRPATTVMPEDYEPVCARCLATYHEAMAWLREDYIL